MGFLNWESYIMPMSLRMSSFALRKWVRFLAFPLLLLVVGCPAYVVRNQRMHPTYVCQSDGNIPNVTWDYSGPRGEVKVFSSSGEELGHAGARSGNLNFSRALVQADRTLKIKVFKDGDEKGSQDLNYVILSGPMDTEEFLAKTEWGAPFQEQVEEKTTDFSTGHAVTTTTTVTVTSQEATQVTWNLDPSWFGSAVQTVEVKYTKGSGALTISGPGIAGSNPMNVGNSRNGNNMNPGGTWTGVFNPPLKRRVDDGSVNVQPPIGLILKVRCQ